MRVCLDARRLPLAFAASVGLATCALILVPANPATSADAATQRQMAAQRPLVRAATLIRQAIDLTAQPGYAGLVIEPTGVALWWKGQVPMRVTALVAEARKLAPVRIAPARYSLAQLKAAARQIQAQAGPDARIQAIKDPGDGSRLVISAPLEARDPAAKSLLMQSVPDVGVETEVVFEPELRPISRNDDAPPWSGGAVIVNTRGFLCTSGFGVIAAGRAAVLTAGHCALANGDVFNDGAGERIGLAAEKTNHDQLIIPTSAAGNRMYVGSRSSNTTKLVTGWEPCFIGELLCQSGVSTAEAIGSELCGLRVLSFNMDEESLVEAEQIDGQQGARPGDSGGPLYSDRGSSVIAKGTMTRVAGARVGFQDIPTANQDFGGISIPGSTGTAAVQLFQHCSFGGWRADFNTTGNISTSQIVAAGGVNNDASSIRIASGFRVTLFVDDNQAGRSVTLTGDNSCFVGVSFNDVLSSMRIERADGVVFFQDINFGGARSQALAPGDYTLSALQARGIPNDWASSVRIPSGRTLTMFQHDNFAGTSWTLTSDTASFLALSPNANDQVSSVRIR